MIIRSYKDALASIRSLYKQVYEEASKATAPREATVRQALATDFGLANPVWSFSGLTANAWNDVINFTVPNNAVVGIYGLNLLDTTNTITAVKVKVGGADVRLWDITDALNGDDNGRTIYFDSADSIVIAENSTVTVSVYATNTDVNFQLLAFIGEERGKTIDKPAL